MGQCFAQVYCSKTQLHAPGRIYRQSTGTRYGTSARRIGLGGHHSCFDTCAHPRGRILWKVAGNVARVADLEETQL